MPVTWQIVSSAFPQAALRGTLELVVAVGKPGLEPGAGKPAGAAGKPAGAAGKPAGAAGKPAGAAGKPAGAAGKPAGAAGNPGGANSTLRCADITDPTTKQLIAKQNRLDEKVNLLAKVLNIVYKF